MKKGFSYRLGQILGVSLILAPLVFGLVVMGRLLDERMDNYVHYITSSASSSDSSSSDSSSADFVIIDPSSFSSTASTVSVADSSADFITDSTVDSTTDSSTDSVTEDIIEEVPSIDITEEEFELLCRMVAHEVGTQKQFENGFYPTLSEDEFNSLQRLMASVAINRVKNGYCESLYSELTDSVQFMTEQELLSVELDDLTKANVWAELCNPLYDENIIFEQSILADSIELAASKMESSLNVNIDTDGVYWYETAEGRYLIFAAPEET